MASAVKWWGRSDCMAPSVWAGWHRQSVNSWLSRNAYLNRATPRSIHHCRLVSICQHQRHEVCTLSHNEVVIVFSAAAVRPHSIRHQPIGLWPRVAVVILELIDWLLRHRFSFIHHRLDGKHRQSCRRRLLTKCWATSGCCCEHRASFRSFFILKKWQHNRQAWWLHLGRIKMQRFLQVSHSRSICNNIL